ncbi:MAG: bifunctional YncE family protein/alkaline phosphatase family protein [Terriglobia bacterium]
MNSSTSGRHLLYMALVVLAGVTFAWAQTGQQPAGPSIPPEVQSSAPPQKSRAASPARPADADEAPVRSVPDPGVIPTRQSITPAGIQAIFESRVYGVTFGATSSEVYALAAPHRGLVIFKMDWQTNKVLEQVHSQGTPGKQGIAFDLVTNAPVVSEVGSEKIEGKVTSSVRLISVANGAAKPIAHALGSTAAGGVAVPPPSREGSSPRYAIIPLTFDDAAAIVDLSTGVLKSSVKTGIAPFGAAINAASTVAYVSNWGGRFPRPRDLTAATGSDKGADLAVVDKRGIAASGTVSRIDIAAGKVTNNIEVGLHPTSLAWDEAHHRLFVSNSNSDTISVIDTAQNKVVETISVQPFERKVAGVAPEAVVVSPDGRRLYAACGGINAVAVIGVGESPRRGSKILGLIPTSWYPDHIALSLDGAYLAVSTLLGVGTGWKTAPIPGFAKELGLELEAGPTRRYVHSDRGTVQVIPVPDSSQLPAYTTAVAENNHLRWRGPGGSVISTAVKPSAAAPIPVPVRAGEPSAIQHIVYIIKENRPYDQILGGIGKGNGDPTLQAYGDEVAPNARELTRQFVLLDNFYASGGNSGDGHQWVTQASETDYTLWPGYQGRSYPKNGDDPLAFADSGFIWDNARQAKKTIADFGEFVGSIHKPDITGRIKLLEEYKAGGSFQGYFHTTAPIAPLNRFVVKDYPAYGLEVPDVVRARIFLQHLKQWETAGTMPNLVLVQLPSDHTAGTHPGFSTPKACIADNDLAVGQIVEGVSHSKFWRSSLIFVVEDDAQSGLDHVDGHRTVALAVSPYIRRGSIDSTFYSQCSMVKTIEMILGLPPMSLFDLIANDMRNSFQAKPDLKPYVAIEPQQSIYEVNPPLAALKGPAREAAIACMHMNFLEPDDVPTQTLNAILWHDAKGWSTPVPNVRKVAFTPQ